MWATVTPLIFVASALALPTLHGRQNTPSWCNGLGAGAFDSASNFTLAAFNVSTPVTSTSGAQLVLGQDGAEDENSFGVLSTYVSYPYNQFPSFSLSSGMLLPNYEEAGMYTSDLSVSAGAEPTFEYSTVQSNIDSSAQIYCAVADTDPDQGSPYPALAVNGDVDNFSLCLTSYGQNNIVYKAVADNNGVYDYSTCYRVDVRLMGTD